MKFSVALSMTVMLGVTCAMNIDADAMFKPKKDEKECPSKELKDALGYPYFPPKGKCNENEMAEKLHPCVLTCAGEAVSAMSSAQPDFPCRDGFDFRCVCKAGKEFNQKLVECFGRNKCVGGRRDKKKVADFCGCVISNECEHQRIASILENKPTPQPSHIKSAVVEAVETGM